MSQATLSVTTLADPIQTYGQLGGTGLITNKALAIPCHLGDPWNSVEYVVLAASSGEEPTQVGEHLQRTDEIYYVLAGQGVLTTNGHREVVEAGDLALAPQGTRHSLSNLSTTQPLAFLVVELKTPPSPEMVHQPTLIKAVGALLSEREPFHAASHPLQVARVDLSSSFAAPWGALSLLRIPPGGRIEEYVVEGADELLFVVNVAQGCATIRAGGHEFRSREQGIGWFESPPGEGLSALIPAGMPRQIINRSCRPNEPLIMLSLEVRREVGAPVVSEQQAREEVGA